MNYYGNIKLKNGLLYAKRPAYQVLTNLSKDEGYQDNRYHIVVQVNNVDVPVLKDLLWVDDSTYIGYTNEGNLFSFQLAKTFNFGSPIISAHVANSDRRQLIILMRDERMRVISIDRESNVPTMDDVYLDEEVVRLSPLCKEVNGSTGWFIITSDNRYLILDDKLTIIFDIKSNRPHHSDVTNVRNGVILSNKEVLLIKRCNKKYNLINYPYIDDIIDILPRVSLSNMSVSIIVLTNTGELHNLEVNCHHRIMNDKARILLSRYEQPGIMKDNYIYIQDNRGEEHQVPDY